MYVAKRNGNVVMYDPEKIIKSILAANQEKRILIVGDGKSVRAVEQKSDEIITRPIAAAITDAVFAKLASVSNVIMASDIKNCVYTELQLRG